MSIPRRSERKTKGIPPERYEDAPDNLKQATESRKSTHPSCTHDKSISRVESKITKSSNSRRKLLEIEIEEARKLAEIERRKAEIDAEMIIKEAQLRRKIIQEGSSKKSTISGAESIFDLREMTFQEKVDNWKTEESDNYVPPMTNNFITMTSDNFNQICETFKINSDKVSYNERTRSVKSKLTFFDGNPEDWPIFHSQFEYSTKIFNILTTMELFNNTGHMKTHDQEIVMKLPPFLRLKWVEESLVEENVTLKIFSAWMRKIAIAASSCADINTHNFHKKRVYENDKYQTKRNANIFSTKKFDKCPCCQKSHLLTDCQKFRKMGIDEKWKEVTSNKLSFYCLKPAHNIYSCRLKQRCDIDGCQKFHNNILHNLDYKKRDEPQVENTPDIVLDQDDHIERINFFQEESPTILLRIIPVKLKGRKKEISTFALLDEAATTTMIDSRIAQEISDLKTNEPIKKSSRLYTLTPFLDGKGILRIGASHEQAIDGERFAVQSSESEEALERGPGKKN
ncbi:hypothetical protein JTB14_023244 [Gonioctena quinquepunctata]|nr:hypothetical protein JTB14_023244 [Gonioctena quinquepunctata]